MPLLVIVFGCLATGTPLLQWTQEPESRGFMVLYLVVAYILHSPLVYYLWVFTRDLRRREFGAMAANYFVLLLGLGLSGLYFSRWFIGFPYIKYLPGLVYLILFVPSLSAGLLGSIRKAKSKDKDISEPEAC